MKLPTNKPYTITIDKRKTYPSYWDNQVAESDSPTLKVGATFRKLHRSNNSTSSVSVHKITTTMPYVYIHCGYDITWRDNKEELLNSLIIEEGTVQTSYENYKETRIPITLNAPLRNLPNGVKDEVDLENGKIIRRVGKAVFDGSSDEKWSLALDPWTKDGIYCFDIQIQNEGVGDRWNALSKMTISDKFQSLSYSEGQTNLTGCLQYTNKGMKVALKQTFATTISDLRAWLQANPTTVYYELATPIEEAITLPNNLRIYDNVTNIYTEGSLIEPNVYCKIPSDVQAIVSELRVENENLRTLTTEQDSAIDTNLLATDEIYRALSPILNISEISDDNDNNKFIDLYKLMMKRNLIEHKDIPIEYQK